MFRRHNPVLNDKNMSEYSFEWLSMSQFMYVVELSLIWKSFYFLVVANPSHSNNGWAIGYALWVLGIENWKHGKIGEYH